MTADTLAEITGNHGDVFESDLEFARRTRAPYTEGEDGNENAENDVR
jgi:hypothetical protein